MGNKEKKNEKNKTEATRDPIVDKVLDLQFYNLPLFKICQMLELTEFEVNQLMESHGYIKILDKYVVKPKPTKKTKKAKKTSTRKRTKKEKTKKELLEEEYKRNPAKRGTFDYTSQVWVVNLQLVEILDLQLEGKNIAEIAKKMKMSKPALIEFMKEKDYVFEDNKFVPERQSNAFKEELKKIEEEKLKKRNEPKITKPRIVNTSVEDVKYTKDEFEEILVDIESMYNWYLKIKDHPIFSKDKC